VQIYREEGLRSFWKGNGTNVIRVAPYAAAQLSSNDFYKRQLSGKRFICQVA
jgi:solute carrier family 25 phosphate transporter 23/24/25/41